MLGVAYQDFLLVAKSQSIAPLYENMNSYRVNLIVPSKVLGGVVVCHFAILPKKLRGVHAEAISRLALLVCGNSKTVRSLNGRVRDNVMRGIRSNVGEDIIVGFYIAHNMPPYKFWIYLALQKLAIHFVEFVRTVQRHSCDNQRTDSDGNGCPISHCAPYVHFILPLMCVVGRVFGAFQSTCHKGNSSLCGGSHE